MQGTRERLHGTSDLTLLLTKSSSLCGIASFKTTNFPVALAQKRCAESYFTGGHELGHNLGAGHNVYEDDGQHDVYNRGYQLPGTTKRTNMAGNKLYTHRNKLNYYSDDVGVDADGDRLGFAGADNSRTINERRFLYENIGDESQACTENFGTLTDRRCP